MDLNSSINFTPSSSPFPQTHDFVPMGSFVLPNYYSHQSAKEDYDQGTGHSGFLQLEKGKIEQFWNLQFSEIQNTAVNKTHHELPLARVKRIMKSNGQVKMISSETPILFSKASELFIMELTLRAWLRTDGCKRRTLQRCDIARAVEHDDQLLEFLVGAVPFDHVHCHKEDDTRSISQDIESRSNEGFADMNQVIQQFMIDPSMSSAEFHHDFFSK